MLLSGLCNERLTAALLAAGVDACGLSGVDRGLLRCTRKWVDGQDLGWVGEVTGLRREVLDDLLGLGVTPVVSPISSVKLEVTTISPGAAMLANCGCISERWYSSSSG